MIRIFDRLPEREIVGCEIADLVRIERSRQSGDERRYHEALALEQRDAQTAGGSRLGVLPNRVDGPSETGPLDARKQDIDERRHARAQVVAVHGIAQHKAEHGGTRDADEPI